MKTGYFWKATHEPDPTTTYVSISRQNQRGAEDMPTYAPLMPSWEIIRLAHEKGYSQECFEEYRRLYYEQLNQLDPWLVYSHLQNCTLVCFESPKDISSGKKFCHRRMVAGWIETHLGIVVPEDVRVKESHLVVPAIYEH